MDTTKERYAEPVLLDHGSVESLTLGDGMLIEEVVGRYDPESV